MKVLKQKIQIADLESQRKKNNLDEIEKVNIT